MGRKIQCRGIEDFRRKKAAEDKRLQKRLNAAIIRAIDKGVTVIKKRAPVGPGDEGGALRDSIRRDGMSIVSDAPHAMPVENGSMPHMPPVEPLQDWAEAMGFDDPEGAGWAIANKISQEGTKPTWFMRGALPEIRRIIDREVKKALGK